MSDNKASKILIVDDDRSFQNFMLYTTINLGYQSFVANYGQGINQLVEIERPDLIILNIVRPKIFGFKLCQELKSQCGLRHIPVIFLTPQDDIEMEVRGLEVGGVDCIHRTFDAEVFDARLKTHLTLGGINRTLEKNAITQSKELERAHQHIIRCLGYAGGYRDGETRMHVLRMSYYSRLLAKKAGMSNSEADLLFQAAQLHDVGKIGIPDSILLKPAKLTKDEMEIMKTHCEKGAKIIGRDKYPLLNMAREIALAHHEKWDGSGYPKGLVENDIPLSARIVAIADVFDALTSDRPYKKRWSLEKTFALLRRECGTHFDPNLIPMFLMLKKDILQIMDIYDDNKLENYKFESNNSTISFSD